MEVTTTKTSAEEKLHPKRLSKGRFPYWPSSPATAKSLEAHELGVLFSGGNPDRAGGEPQWRQVRAG